MSGENRNSTLGTTHVGTDAFVRPVERSATAADGKARAYRALATTLATILATTFAMTLAMILALLTLGCAQAMSQAMTKGIMSPPSNVRPTYLQNVGIEQHLDGQVPADLSFVDDEGRAVRLGDYFGKKPLILNLAYYKCTMLCGEALSGLAGSMKMVKFNAGDEFEVITVSFNPQETPTMAAEKKKDYVKRYGRPGAAAGWHFLTGPAESINALTKAVGFQYQYDPKINQYAHATALMVLTPQGRISRYFYGVDYPPKDLRMGLVEASQGKIGNAVDTVLLYCYHYDPATGKYGAIVTNILQIGAGLTILLLGGLLFILFRLDKAAQRRIAVQTRARQAEV